MCGIAGIIGRQVSADAIGSCSDSLQHRGPDAAGVYQQDDVCFIHRRLSIIDLSEAANQPMYSADGRWVLVFNGEIYNYRELREKLIAKGISFSTQSDTEVVLKSYQVYGAACVQDFIGMFAIALYDRQEEQLTLIRDRAGVKPLYFYKGQDLILFGSELRALLSWGLIDTQIDQSALAAYLSFGYLPGNHCIIDGVQKVQPGHMITWDKKTGRMDTASYWSVTDAIKPRQQAQQSLEAYTEELEALMISAVKYRMVADVPVGVFLSGGVDSSLVTALLQKHFGQVSTFTIGFDDPAYNESGYADKIAAHLGTDHHTRILTAADARDVLDEYFAMYDEPFADSSGIPTNLVARFARDKGCKVVLSADGGDELFGGYGRYTAAAEAFRACKKMSAATTAYTGLYRGMLHHTRHMGWNNAGNKLAKLNDRMLAARQGFGAFYPAYLSVPSQTLVGRLTGKHFPETLTAAESNSFAATMMHWDFKHYLPDDLLVKVDRATMYNNIEGREPMLDHRLVEFAFNLPLQYKISGTQHKLILRQLLDKYVPRTFFERPKMGFSIPLFKWFGQELEHEFSWAFDPATLAALDYLDTGEVLRQYRLYQQFRKQNKQDNLLLIWHLYCLVKWHHRYMKKQ